MWGCRFRGRKACHSSRKVRRRLCKIRAALDGLSVPFVQLAQANANSAINEASEKQVNKDAIEAALETALEAAKKSAGFISITAKLVGQHRGGTARSLVGAFE
jgi:hypothetical protein